MSGEVCIANIDRRGQTMRARAGWAALAFAVVLIVLVVITDAPRLHRVAIYVPAMLGASGVLQAREKT